jgi:hypothetical protein
MGRYANHEDFGANAPINFREDTTSESYLKGMYGIAPPGMKPKAMRGKRYEDNTDFKASVKWHRNFDIAMFGGTDIGFPETETKQMGLEQKIDGIERKPGRR